MKNLATRYSTYSKLLPQFIVGLILITLVGLVAVMNQVKAAFLSVPGTYATIQAAVNAAQNGDTIVVSPGTYLEHVVISGKLTARQT